MAGYVMNSQAKIDKNDILFGSKEGMVLKLMSNSKTKSLGVNILFCVDLTS